jgi:hypothetical protein
MVILAMSPFILGIGILFYGLYYFMNGKHLEAIKDVRKYINNTQRAKVKKIVKGDFEVIKGKDGKYLLKIGGSKNEV